MNGHLSNLIEFMSQKIGCHQTHLELGEVGNMKITICDFSKVPRQSFYCMYFAFLVQKITLIF